MLLSLAFYRLAVKTYTAAIALAAPFHQKAKAWTAGRKNWRKQTAQQLPPKTATLRRVWVHCASLGEFEQGRPLIESLTQHYGSDVEIILSFFSPSGYEVRRNYPLAAAVLYMPADTAANARDFYDLVQPDLVVFVKYEIWYFFLQEAHQRQIPAVLISAYFDNNKPYFKWYGVTLRRALHFFDKIFVQNENSLRLLQHIGIAHCQIAPDTRFDRVAATAAAHAAELRWLADFKQTQPLIVAGSTWQADEAALMLWSAQKEAASWKILIAPHEINEKEIVALCEVWQNRGVVRYTQLQATDRPEALLARAQVLILDTIGLLSQCYRYADIAYIGGGFGKGIHNILEAAVFGVPLVFGKKYQSFNEAVELVAAGGAVAAATPENAAVLLGELCCHEPKRRQRGSINAQYVQQRRGGTAIIMQYIQQLLKK